MEGGFIEEGCGYKQWRRECRHSAAKAVAFRSRRGATLICENLSAAKVMSFSESDRLSEYLSPWPFAEEELFHCGDVSGPGRARSVRVCFWHGCRRRVRATG